MGKKDKRAPRKWSSQRTKDDHRNHSQYIHKCGLCGLKIPSNHEIAGRVLGRHMASAECQQRRLNSQREDVCEGPPEFDGDEMAACGGGNSDDVEVDGDIYSDCPHSSIEDEDEHCVVDVEDEFGAKYLEDLSDVDVDLDEEFDFHDSLEEEAPPTGEVMNCVNVAMVTSDVPLLSREDSGKKGCWWKHEEFGNTVKFGKDYFCLDHVAAQTLPVGRPPALGPADRKIFNYQQKLVKVYFTAADEESGRAQKPLVLNKRRGETKDWKDCITLYFFCCTYKLLTGPQEMLCLHLSTRFPGIMGFLFLCTRIGAAWLRRWKRSSPPFIH